MHMRDYKRPGNVYSETHAFRVKGYVIAEMVLLRHFTEEETETPNYGLGSPMSHIV